MKRLIILLLAALMALLSCAENGSDYQFDNPWDDRGTNYNGGSRTITFDPNGGTVSPTPGKTNRDKKLDSLPTPARDGYDFNGWWTAQMNGTKVDVNTIYDDNSIVYARWTIKIYDVTFNSQNGSAVSSQRIEYGNKVTEPASPPTRDGYTFGGWYKEAACTNAWDFTSDVVTSTRTLYAKWDKVPVSVETFTDTRDNKEYKKVKIGTQTWMAENLNYDVPNNTSDVCYGNNPDNCEKYGRLYNWSTAMGESSSSSLSPSGVQGVCPAGWHIPSDAEWTALTDAIGGASTAGTKLKAASGWYHDYDWRSGNGTDEYGFSALPGGGRGSGDNFSDAGADGYWWSATEDDAYNARIRHMRYNIESAYRGVVSKTYLDAVRCVMDAEIQTPTTYTVTFDANGGTVSPTSDTTGADGKLASLPTPTRSGDIFVGWFTEAAGGTKVEVSKVYSANANIYARWVESFEDSRDGKTYKKVMIGNQTWMAENLNYDGKENGGNEIGACYNNSADSCEKYGRLYNWSTAMDINASYDSSYWNGSDVNHQGICPAGWHLPSSAERVALVNYVGSSAGTKLKSTSSWYNNGNGTDEYGWSALPGGVGFDDDFFLNAGEHGVWWSATEIDTISADYQSMSYSDGASLSWNNFNKPFLFSVRCVADQ